MCEALGHQQTGGGERATGSGMVSVMHVHTNLSSNARVVLNVFLQLFVSILGTYPTKSTPIHCLQFTRKNLLLAAGPYLK